MKDIYDIAIIGAGPAGIAASCEAVIFGMEKILLFEKTSNHSDTIRTYFKDNKPVDKDWKGIHVELQGHISFEGGTKESTLDLFNESLEKHLIEARFHTEVASVERKDELFKIFTNTNEEYYARNIVIAIGKMGKPNKPEYKLPKSSKINYNISECKADEEVLVVGGGDSACEFAYFIHEHSRVMLNYRKEQITRAHPKNKENLLQIAKEGKVELKLGVDINSVEEIGGRLKVDFNDGSSIEFDRIVYALGGSTPKEFLQNCNVLLDEKDKPVVDERYQNSQGVYIAGDIAGPIGGSIALALNHGYNIIKDIKK
jgi:thioredoxin reductase (NADPH)